MNSQDLRYTYDSKAVLLNGEYTGVQVSVRLPDLTPPVPWSLFTRERNIQFTVYLKLIISELQIAIT